MSAAITNLESEYLEQMFRGLNYWLHILPSELQRTIKIAESLHRYPGATSEELKAELGPNWVIARRTKNIVEKYGTDVNCVSHREYVEAERAAIAKRFK